MSLDKDNALHARTSLNPSIPTPILPTVLWSRSQKHNTFLQCVSSAAGGSDLVWRWEAHCPGTMAGRRHCWGSSREQGLASSLQPPRLCEQLKMLKIDNCDSSPARGGMKACLVCVPARCWCIGLQLRTDPCPCVRLSPNKCFFGCVSAAPCSRNPSRCCAHGKRWGFGSGHLE